MRSSLCFVRISYVRKFILPVLLTCCIGCKDDAASSDPLPGVGKKADSAPRGTRQRDSQVDYAEQANTNAIKGEDMPENKAPDDGGSGRTGR